jgi:hypothetical protein
MPPLSAGDESAIALLACGLACAVALTLTWMVVRDWWNRHHGGRDRSTIPWGMLEIPSRQP